MKGSDLTQDGYLKTSATVFIWVVVCSFPLLYRLGYLEIKLWDEGRNAVNAYEMLQNGKIFIRYYEGTPDFWELKPPLLIWLQALSMKLVGYNEFAVRLPSVVFALLSFLLIAHFLRKELNQTLAGYCAALVLLTSPGYLGAHGYIGNHVARTGDHESMLLFFLTLSVLYFFKYVEDGRRKKHLLIITFGLICATFTKSILGLAFLPGMLVYLLWRRQLKVVFSQYMVYIAILSYVVIIGAYYTYREWATPGYLDHVWNNELLMRYLNRSKYFPFDDHGFLYYLKNFFDTRFVPWIYFFPLAASLVFFIKDRQTHHFAELLLICILIFFVVISLGTNNAWYDVPLYPMMALILGLGLSFLYKTIVPHINQLKHLSANYIQALFLLIVFAFPYTYMIHRISQEDNRNDRFADKLSYGKFMKQLKEEAPSLKHYTVLDKGFNTPLYFYRSVLNDQYDYNIKHTENAENLRPGQQIVFCGNTLQLELEKYHTFTVMDTCHTCQLIKILQETSAYSIDNGNHEIR